MNKLNFDKLNNAIESMPIFGAVSRVATKSGIEVYVVGGYVRDRLLDIGNEQDEADFTVIGDGPAFAAEVAAEIRVKNVSYFKNFGTAKFDFQNTPYEFVGARRESYSVESRKPSVEKGVFIDDIRRRDFTINTLAVSLNEPGRGNLADLFNGIADLEKGIIRTPLKPDKTFSDDPLRILRAIRFAAKLNFKIEDETWEGIKKNVTRLEIISQERITDEFLKILSLPKPSVGLKLLHESGAFAFFFPEISLLAGIEQRKEYHHKDVFLHTLEVVDNISAVTENVWLRFAALVHDIAKPNTKKFVEGTGWTFHGHEELGARMMKRIFRKMKLPLHELPYVEKLVRLHLRPIALVDEEVTDSAIRRLVVNAGENLDDLISLCRADITSKNPSKVRRYLSNYEKVMLRVKEVEEKDKLREFQSPVRGEEIMKVCGIPPGRMVGVIKTQIEEAILDGIIPNEYDAAYEYFLKIKNRIMNN